MKLGTNAEIVADSIAPNGCRLTTMLLTYSRMVHAELMSHRVFSRNGASSRAIPIHKKLQRIEESPIEPIEWGMNRPGMQATEIIPPENIEKAKAVWHRARRVAMRCAKKLEDLKVHKQIGNRIIEPWDWMVLLVSSTSWRNFDVLRQHKTADPHIQALANIRKEVYDASHPVGMIPGEWHLPFISWDEEVSWTVEKCKQVSAGRCARLSYLTHDGVRDPEKDLDLFKRLVVREDPENEPGHWTPVEHQATPIGGFSFVTKNPETDPECIWCNGEITKKAVYFNQTGIVCRMCALGHISSGNFIGWKQHRKEYSYDDFDA